MFNIIAAFELTGEDARIKFSGSETYLSIPYDTKTIHFASDREGREPALVINPVGFQVREVLDDETKEQTGVHLVSVLNSTGESIGLGFWKKPETIERISVASVFVKTLNDIWNVQPDHVMPPIPKEEAVKKIRALYAYDTLK